MTAWWGSNLPPIAMPKIDVFKLFDGTFMHEVRIVARAR